MKKNQGLRRKIGIRNVMAVKLSNDKFIPFIEKGFATDGEDKPHHWWWCDLGIVYPRKFVIDNTEELAESLKSLLYVSCVDDANAFEEKMNALKNAFAKPVAFDPQNFEVSVFHFINDDIKIETFYPDSEQDLLTFLTFNEEKDIGIRWNEKGKKDC